MLQPFCRAAKPPVLAKAFFTFTFDIRVPTPWFDGGPSPDQGHWGDQISGRSKLRGFQFSIDSRFESTELLPAALFKMFLFVGVNFPLIKGELLPDFR